jgi:transposase
MARAHLKLTVSLTQKAELEQRFKAADDVRHRQRLQAMLLATTGQHGYRDIAQIVGCSPSTFGLWLNKFLAGGISELLRRETPPGSSSPIGQARVQAELVAGLKSGRWRTAGQVAAWLQEAHGIKRAAKSMYRWLGKANGALRVPRPAHVLQNPPPPSAPNWSKGSNNWPCPRINRSRFGWRMKAALVFIHRAGGAGPCAVSGS